MILKICAVLLLVTNISQLQRLDNQVENSCDRKVTCSKCIGTSNCAWCMEPFMDRRPRCFNSSLTTSHCQKEYQWNPKNEQSPLGIPKLTSGGSIEDYSVPQRIGLKLRMNEPLQFQFQYSEGQVFPLDLYFVMDLSKSMEDDREKLLRLGEMLAQNIPTISSNFRLGFGSFVNKISLSSSSPKSVETAYAFKNHMSLGTDAVLFSDGVRRAAVSGNSTYYGAGLISLQAIKQAIVCRGQIGWREQARRIIVFSTNTGFDYAEDDQRYDGSLLRFDNNCHLDASGMYTESRAQDNPSVSQISKIIRDYAINVIFAVTSSTWEVYENLSHQLLGSSLGILSEDPTNVVELVREDYNKISASVEMKDNSSSSLKITYSSSCFGSRPILTNQCDGLKTGDTVLFNTEVVVTSCPQNDRNLKQIFQIYPVGNFESLLVDLEIQCRCQFENSTTCGNNYSEHEQNSNCRPDNSSLVCSGRGSCVCGICECNERSHLDEFISGQFCECDNFSCDRHNALLCSGSDHGTCSCGVCHCQPGWTGDACDQKFSSPLAVAQPVEQGTFDKTQCSNDYDLFTEMEIKLILEDIFKGLRQCKTKDDQLRLMITLAVKYIYRRP